MQARTWSSEAVPGSPFEPARHGRRRWCTLLAQGAVLPAILGVGAVAGTVPLAPPSAAAATKPNIVVIVSDDQRLDDLAVMSTVQSELAAKGTTFTNAFASNPTCCPSRAALLTGRYSHANGVYTNGPDCQGNRAFDDRTTVATALDGAGYRTALVGKYLNSYQGTAVPKGWDDWHAFSGYYDNGGGAYYDYQLNHNGRLQSYGAAGADYSTDVLATQAGRTIRETPADQPLFMLFTPFGPHGGQKPAPRHKGAFDGMVIPHGPDFNEADVSDKPAYIRNLPLLSADELRLRDGERRRARESLLSVDEAVATVLTALRDTGRLANTMIVYESDQGFSRGEHRYYERKLVPYEDVIRIPMIVRYDALGGGQRVDGRLAANIDVAPTAVDAAGTVLPGAEGRSLLPMLTGAATGPRDEVLLEHTQTGDPVPSYCGVRTVNRTFVRYETGELELYDLAADPYQLTNRATDLAYAAEVQAFDATLRLRCHPPSRFTTTQPYRLFDTRASGGAVPAGTVHVATVVGGGAGKVPADAVAVALNVTAVGAQGEGYVTVFPTGAPAPNASVLNLVAGDTAPNFVVAPIGSGGRVSFLVAGAATDLIADVSGWFVPITGTTATAGRFVPLTPARILDTRTGVGYAGPVPTRGATVTVPVLGNGGVPAKGVTAVAMNITAVDAAAPGYVTAFAGGAARPNASNLNLTRAGQVRANLVLVPVGPNGTVNLFTDAGGHLLADVAGYVTDATAAASGSGLFVPVQPVRLRDTRVTPPVGAVPAGGTVDASVIAGGLPVSGAAVLVNVTAAGATRPGYVTLYPAGEARPATSTLNVERPRQTLPNAAVVRLGAAGTFTAYSDGGTYLLFDAGGWFTS